MAYADKSTDMRRCCLARGRHVQWEGVEIDGCHFLMLKRAGWGEMESVLHLTKDELNEKIKQYNGDLDTCESEFPDEPLLLLYQDEEDCNWNVSNAYNKKMVLIGLKDKEDEN